MKMKMIVLRETKLPKKEFALVSTKGDGGEARSKLTISLEETDEQQRRELRKEVGTIAAPPMPIMLIRSFRAGDDDAQPPQENWGLSAVKATSSKFTGRGVTVAVLDTGIDATHPAFAGVTLKQENFTNEPPEDIDGHGTHCAGTIFGRDVDGLRIGVARGISKALIGKVVGKNGASTAEVARAISWAQLNGAQVISMSLGMDFIGYQRMLQDEYKLPERQATSVALAGYRDNVRMFDKISGATSSKLAILNSAVVVAAAGNESERPNYSITVAPPAAAEFFLSVAAVGPAKSGTPPLVLAPFSNDGAMFAAPGVDVWSARRGGGLVAMSGTSMATPHVAGVAALCAETLGEKNFTAARTIELMSKNSLSLAPGISEDDARYGLVQAP
jgi:subtilisin family serine protease